MHRHWPTIEDVSAGFDKISSLKNGKEHEELNAVIGDVINAFSSPQKGDAPLLTILPVNSPMWPPYLMPCPALSSPDAAKGVNVIFQYDISGGTGGNWFCEISDGACSVSAGSA
jgi:hypothetical protein